MFLSIITVFGIFLSTGVALDCDLKGASPDQCIDVVRNYSVVHEYPTD